MRCTAFAVNFMDVARAKRLIQEDAAVACALAAESVRHLYNANEELAGNTFATVKQRIVRHLLDLAAGEGDGRLVALVSQQGSRNSVGSVREVVARILQELRAASLVRTSPGLVEITDPIGMARELWSRRSSRTLVLTADVATPKVGVRSALPKWSEAYTKV